MGFLLLCSYKVLRTLYLFWFLVVFGFVSSVSFIGHLGIHLILVELVIILYNLGFQILVINKNVPNKKEKTKIG